MGASQRLRVPIGLFPNCVTSSGRVSQRETQVVQSQQAVPSAHRAPQRRIPHPAPLLEVRGAVQFLWGGLHGSGSTAQCWVLWRRQEHCQALQ